MIGTCSKELENRGSTPVSLFDVLHQAPRLYQLLQPCSRQKLSATCSYLLTWVRQITSCVRVTHHNHLLQIAPKDWPNLAGVVHGAGLTWHNDSKSLLQGRWQLDAQLCFDSFGEAKDDEDILQLMESFQYEVVLLISPLRESQQAVSDLTLRQCEILAQCVETASLRRNTVNITVGPQQQSATIGGTLTASSALCLPGNVWSCVGYQEWPAVYLLDMRNQQFSLACAQGFIRCRFPAVQQVYWGGAKLDAGVCAELCQACLPLLVQLSLADQGLSGGGLQGLLQAAWPRLATLDLANNNLDPLAVTALSNSSRCRKLEQLCLRGNPLGEAGVRALALGQWEALRVCDLQHCSTTSHAAVTCLAQAHFPELLYLNLTDNPFEAGAIARLSGAQWPTLECITLGLYDIDDHDYESLGIHDFYNETERSNGFLYIYPTEFALLPNVRFTIVL